MFKDYIQIALKTLWSILLLKNNTFWSFTRLYKWSFLMADTLTHHSMKTTHVTEDINHDSIASKYRPKWNAAIINVIN